MKQIVLGLLLFYVCNIVENTD